MRVVAVVDRTWPCDHSFIEEVLARELPARGHEIVVIMAAAQPADVGRHSWHGCVVSAVMATSRFTLAIKAMGEVTRLNRKNRVDWILVRNEVIAAYLLSLTAKTPIAFQLSHMKEETAILQGSSDGQLKGWYRETLARGARQLRRVLMRRVDLVLPVSRFMADELERSGERLDGMLVTPLSAVANPPKNDLGRDDLRTEIGVRKDQVMLLYVGTLNRLRRLDTLVNALSLIRARELDAVLVFLGDGPRRSDRDSLILAAEEFGVQDATFFLRAVPRRQVTEYIWAADFGLSYFPDEPLFCQNSPIKIMEYLAAGLPVVCTRQPEQEMLVTRTQGGLVAEGYSASAIADAVIAAAGREWSRSRICEQFVRARSYSSIAATLEQELITRGRRRLAE